MAIEVPAISSQRLERIDDFFVDFTGSITGGDEQLKEDDHGDQYDLACIAKAEKDKDNRHQYNFWNGVTEIDEGREEAIEPFIAAEKESKGDCCEKGNDKTCTDPERTCFHVFPEIVLPDLFKSLAKRLK